MTCIPCQKQLSNKLTNSRMRSFYNCQKRHYYEYEVGLRKTDSGEALRKGSAFHLGLEIYGKTEGDSEARLLAGIIAITENYSIIPAWADPYLWECEMEYVIALYVAHVHRWQHDEIEIVETEKAFEVPLYNPMRWNEKANASRNFVLAGKIDKIIKLPDGRLAILDYKTASDDLSPVSDYWKRLRIDSQISLYLLAAREMGYNVETIIYDVTRKPMQQPLRKTENIHYKANGEPYAGTRLEDETPEEYGKRIYKVLTEKTDDRDPSEYYFARREIPRLEGDLESFKWDVWNAAKQIRENYIQGRHVRNSQACVTVFGKCPYFDICVNDEDVTDFAPEGFTFLKNVHPELN